MKTYRKNSREETLKTNLWDAFVNHIESIYFTGASELLDRKTLTFEFESFKKDFVMDM